MLTAAFAIVTVLVVATLLLRQQVMMRDIERAGMSERLTYSHEGRRFRMNLSELHREVKPRSRFRHMMRSVLWVECSLFVVLLSAVILRNLGPQDQHVPPPIHPNGSSSTK